MSRIHLFAFTVLVAACGGNQPEAAAPAATAEPAAAPAAQATPAAPSTAAAAAKSTIDACLATANVGRARFSGEPPKVTVKHVLVKYKGAKKADDKITRSRGEACLRAIEARDKIRGGEDFDAVVKAYSEEAGAATRNGSIGSVERKDLAKPFADAAFELKLNEMSDVVETEFGFHVIMRTE